jgi:hypothetical protein
MNVDAILDGFNRHGVAYLLIGGMNFLLRHHPVLTYDVDVWIQDTLENRIRCEEALAEMGAEWGPSDREWGPVSRYNSGWLARQGVYCLTSPHGAIDVFRTVKGLASWAEARARANGSRTSSGVPYMALSDEDMLQCQLALPEPKRRPDRIAALRRSLGMSDDD